MGELVFGQQCHVLHGLRMFEQRFAGRRQFIALGMLHEQRRAEAFLDGVDMPGHGGMRGFQALGGGEQAATALQLEKKPQVIPVEHIASRAWARRRCLKTHSGWVKTNIFKTKTNN